MATFANSLIRYKIEMNENAVPASATITFTDTIAALYAATYGFTQTNIRGKLLLYAPDGSVRQSDTSPVITGVVPTWSASITPAMDADGNIQTGLYSGSYSVSVDAGVTYAYTIAISLTYSYTTPTVVINFTTSIPDSELLVEDDTVYNVNNALGVSIVPTKTYSMVISYPKKSDGTSQAVDITTATRTYTVGPNIYTRVFQATVATTVQYYMDTWTGGDPKLVTNDLIEGSDKIDIRVPNAIAQYYDSMVLLQAKYDSVTYNNQERLRLREIQTQINDNYRMYEVAIEAGEDYTDFVQNIEDLLQAAGVVVLPADDISVEITPASGGAGTPGVRGSVITMGTGAAGLPVAGMLSGDVHIFNADGGVYTKGDLYKYSGAAWVYQYAVAGVSGYSGYSGDTGIGTYNVIEADVTPVGTSAGTLEEDLYSYTMPADTLEEAGDNVELFVNLYLGVNSNGKTIKIYFGGTIMDTFFTDSTVVASDKYIQAYMRINSVTDLDQNVTTKFTRSGGYTTGYLLTATTKDATSPQILKITGQNTVASANDIVYTDALVIKNQVTPAP